MVVTARSAPDRRYRGSSGEERRTQRREQFLRAAVGIYGERGYRNATVRAVCEEAGLTERYFYESFANSEALLVASFEAVNRILFSEIKKAGAAAAGGPIERTRAILNAYFEALKRDPGSARVFLIEIAGVSPAVDQVLATSLDVFGDLIALTLDPDETSGAARNPLMRTGVVGGVLYLALTWIKSGYAQPRAAVVEAALQLSLSLRSECSADA